MQTEYLKFSQLIFVSENSAAINSVAFSLDGTRIVSGSYDKTLQLWGMRTPACPSASHSRAIRTRFSESPSARTAPVSSPAVGIKPRASGTRTPSSPSASRIKPAVQDAGLKCVRADEIPHAGTIDMPMFEQLMQADLVVAELSTSNLNAAYELGVRHALKPRTTIIIAEEQFASSFDINHIVTLPYRLDGKVLDIEEAARFRAVLANAITAILPQKQTGQSCIHFSPTADAARIWRRKGSGCEGNSDGCQCRYCQRQCQQSDPCIPHGTNKRSQESSPHGAIE